MITFGEWLPDQPQMNNTITTAENVIPAAQGYRSFPQFIEYSGAASDTIRGIFAAKDNDGNVELFAGDSTNLYKFDTTDSSLDVVSSATHSLANSEKWRFVQFGENVYAAGGVGESIQAWQVGTSTQFAVLSTDAPKADYIAVVRDFIFTANIDEGSGRLPYRTKWSGFNTATDWTAGTNQSDFQDIPDAGAITGLIGGEYATILMERAIVRATYSGLPLVFQFDKVETQRGCKYSGSVCNVGSVVFFLSDDGFYAFDGQKTTPIGAEKVNDFFLTDFNSNFAKNMSASVDPQNQIAMWSYASTQSTTGVPDKMLIYNYVLGKWSLLKVSANYIAPFFSSGYTMDQLDNISATLDGLSSALDSALYKGGEYFFGGALGSKLYTFTGDPLAATIETGDIPLSQGKHSIVTRVYPYHEGGTATVQIGTKNTPTGTATLGTAASMNDEGFAPFRESGRYHRLRMNLTGNWTTAQGIDVEAREIGRR